MLFWVDVARFWVSGDTAMVMHFCIYVYHIHLYHIVPQRRQAITWTHGGQDLWRHIGLLCHNKLIVILGILQYFQETCGGTPRTRFHFISIYSYMYITQRFIYIGEWIACYQIIISISNRQFRCWYWIFVLYSHREFCLRSKSHTHPDLRTWNVGVMRLHTAVSVMSIVPSYGELEKKLSNQTLTKNKDLWHKYRYQ